MYCISRADGIDDTYKLPRVNWAEEGAKLTQKKDQPVLQ